MELFIYSGIGQLPSIDFDCLRITAYVKFKEIPVKILTNGNPYHASTGFLPYLKDHNEIIAGYDEIIEYFRSKGFDYDDFLSNSYMNYFESQFLPYFTYLLWGDPINADTTRILYAKRIPFPFNFVYPQKYIQRASDYLKIVANFSIEDKLINHNTADISLNAKKYLKMLAEKIEKKRWFFGGQKPDELDASIYAALSILTNLQLQNNDLKSHITECPSLINYIDRVRKKYLMDIRIVESESKQAVFDRIQNVFINKEKGTVSNAVIKTLFGLLTISTMVFFAISHGLLEIVTDDDDAQYYDGGDDDAEHFSEE
ncbi:metaxin-1 homolog isoform X2 [Contarinia nasturtii]|uniref:metaxin-1 homolog isoform X1 n=1 Tax=Contarinia nasturtii TaxID=265458 RepID=UPI0012D4555A|nr:metaxin-1 homolog isoform X1 [Contarinia nasturtii]XP_031635899.1 metaxin-1 homolog isoform X2 [Contarinia nasturtii]